MWNGLRPFTAAKYSIADQVLARKAAKQSQTGLYFNPYGKVLELITMTVSPAVWDQLIDANGGPVWTEEGFAALHEKSPR